MKYIFTDQLTNTKYMKGVWDILCECDNDFIPPLSSRESSRQMNLKGLENKTLKPKSYYDLMVKQKFVLVLNDLDELVAFMTFIYSYECPELKTIGASNYVSTICVANEYRKKGILKQLYKYMINDLPKQYIMPYITTRTWSKNAYHLLGLEHMGFNAVNTIINHRGPGIDTVYFALKL